MTTASVMRGNFFARRIRSIPTLELQLLDELLVEITHRVELELLPVQHVAEFLQRPLEVRDLEFNRVESLATHVVTHAVSRAVCRRSCMISPAAATSSS